VARYVEGIKTKVAKTGYVETLFGRKRFLPEINSSAWNLRQEAERAAINFPIQGTAADLVKMAMAEINLKLKTFNLKLLLQVHDELLFEVVENEINNLAPRIKEIMESVYALAAPLKVKTEIGYNWGELKKLQDN